MISHLSLASALTGALLGAPAQIAPNRDLGAQVFGELARGAIAYQLGVFNGVADGQRGDGDVSDDKEVAARVFVKPFAAGGPLVKELGVGVAATYGTHRTRASRRPGRSIVDWFPTKNLRFVVDFERTWYDRGAKDGGTKPAESSVVGRVQTIF
jgi:hypothetical protein